MQLSQYRLEPLRKDGEFVLYRGLSQTKPETSPRSILALSPITEHPAPATVKKLEHEFALKDDLDPEWAIRPIALTQQGSRTILLFEDLNGEPLDRLPGRPLELKEFLRLGIALAASLGQVHRRGLIHKDIKPSNVLANSAMDQTWLTGFGIASRLTRERGAAEPPEFIAGTLAYMAPEQTGRMNRSIDSRSDLYAFGVTLYELLTGTLPFTASDPMEWIHCHIARQPLPPAERLKGIPQVVSAIIVKLLAKTPEERYQTAAGVESDLRRCIEDWDRGGAVHDFALGQHDRPDGLLIPEKLYGREREISTLLACFERVVKSGKPELVLVSGYSGIGKSSVVNELHRELVLTRGLFASGKFDQLKRDIPYATVAQALQTLIRQILGKPEVEMSRWREQLRQALDPNCALVTDLIPELKFIIGEQPAVPDVSPAATKVRLQTAIRGLIGVFARVEHPLALFLDDLQWLDAATLDLLESILVESELHHLLLVGAYRDNEVDAAHPLMRKLSALRRSGAVVTELVLGPLTQEDFTHWFGDAFQAEAESVRPLARLVHEKTAGNAFFANQVLQELAEDGLVTFDSAHHGWRWALEPIRAKGYTENVVDLMVGKLSRLPLTTQEALKSLACLGNTADTSTLAMIHGTSEEQLHSHLWEALHLEMIVRSDDSYRFVHDRVQEAAYCLVSEGQRAPEHLRIGRLLARQVTPDKREESVFEIVGHFNRAAALIVSQEERNEVAALNLAAGKRAKKAAAYNSALKYLTAGATLVVTDQQRRDLVFELEIHRTECEFLTGEVTSAEERLRMLSSRTLSVAERAAVVCIQADIYLALQTPERVLLEGAACLRQAGFAIPLRPTESDARTVFDGTCSRLDGIGINEVAALPIMTNPTSRAILNMLPKLETCAASLDRTFEVLIICSAVALTLERGIHDTSCLAFTQLGYLAAWRYGNFEAGFRFGQLGYELVERTGLRRFEDYVVLNFSALLMPWAKHVASCLPVIRRAFDVAHNNGDRLWAAASLHVLLSKLLLAGNSLVEVEAETEASLAYCRVAAFPDYIDAVSTQAALIRNLRGSTRQFGLLDDDRFDELRIENHFANESHLPVIQCWYWIRKLQARFLAGDYMAALEASRRAQDSLTSLAGTLERAEYEFYSGLVHAALCQSPSSDDGRQHLEAIVAHLRQLEIWAQHCPENFENRAALLAAEIARIEARDYDAAQLYENAIRSARQSGFLHSECLALEIAARFYMARGFDRIAKTYLRDARYGYQQWGADGKVQQLDRLYPELKQEPPVAGPTATITVPVEGLDLATVIRVSQAVSGEIVLEKLLDIVMRNAMEHAGAERGLLIFPQGDRLQMKAEAISVGDRLAVHTLEAAISPADVPESVVRYVMRTQEQLIIEDASVPTFLPTDEYLHEKRPRSVACLPLLKQGILIALLYLENKLVSNVFSPARLKLLEVLASQAAISLENSRLYHEIRLAEEALRQSEHQLRDVIQTMPVMAFTALPDGSTDFVNRRFSDFTGLIADDVSPLQLTTLHPEDLETHARKWRTCLETGESLESEVRHRGKDGQYRWFLVRGSPLRDEKGNVLKWFGSLTDIEERKQAEDRLRNENVVLREEIDTGAMFEEIVGTSAALQAVLARVAKVAPTDSTGLITGETGTGKELVARAIHKRSRRSGRPFVSVNCAAFAPSLIASELFGHEKGAFTGAAQRRLGRFELADGGTLFLDEVGELPHDVQVSLLRVLQEREFERIGGGQSIRVDVRVIAATNRDLKAAVANGTFRKDLFYRLDVFPIEVPPLRDRKDDILMLVEYFLQRYATRMAKKIDSVDKKTLDLLQSYDWPGNIRELQNIIERSVILSSGDVLSVDEMWLSKQTPGLTSWVETSPTFKVEGGRSEREVIESALAETRGRVSGPSGAAAKLRIPASTLASRIKALKINTQQFKFN